MARTIRVYRCSRLSPELWEVELLMLFAGETPPPLPVFAEVLTGCWRLLADAEAARLEAGGMEKDEAWEQAIRRMPAGVQSRLDGALGRFRPERRDVLLSNWPLR